MFFKRFQTPVTRTRLHGDAHVMVPVEPGTSRGEAIRLLNEELARVGMQYDVELKFDLDDIKAETGYDLVKFMTAFDSIITKVQATKPAFVSLGDTIRYFREKLAMACGIPVEYLPPKPGEPNGNGRVYTVETIEEAKKLFAEKGAADE